MCRPYPSPLIPLESRSDPNFQEDEGNHFLETFQEEWNVWLEQELGAQGPGHAQWEEVLNHMVLKEIRAFAFSLCQDLISIPELEKQVGSETLAPAFAAWLQTKQQQVRALLLQYDRPKPRKIERLIALTGQVFDHVGQPGWQGVSPLSESDRALFDSVVGKAPGEWNHADFQDAKRAIQAGTPTVASQ